MKATKAGIWIDHDHAYLIEFTDAMQVTRIGSAKKASRKSNLRFGEKRMHATEQRHDASYYKDMGELIGQYKDILLFGPGMARKELFNLLYEHHVLRQVRVTTVRTGKLTPRQMVAFVRKNFVPVKLPV